MAQVFNDSYIASEDHRGWRFNTFGFPGDTPQINSQERFHLLAKGCRFLEGMMDIGLCTNEMLNVQFPKLIWEVSSKVDNLDRLYRIRDKAALDLDRTLMDQVAKLNKEVDVVRWPTDGGWFVNGVGYEGTPIDTERINRYKQAIQGKFGSCEDPSKRREDCMSPFLYFEV